MLDWQLIIVGVCLAAAAAWIIWRAMRLVRGHSAAGCGTACATCPQQDSTATSPPGFVPLEQLLDSTGPTNK